MMEEPEHLQKLQENIRYCKDSLLAAGFDITVSLVTANRYKIMHT